MVECGGLENRLARKGHEGSNPSSSASTIDELLLGAFFMSKRSDRKRGIRTRQGAKRDWRASANRMGF